MASSAAPLARKTMAYVLAGGQGSRLLKLTDKRAKPAVYSGGKRQQGKNCDTTRKNYVRFSRR